NVSITVPPPGQIPEDIVGEYWSDELMVRWTIAERDNDYWLSRGTVPDLRVTASSVPDFPQGTPPGGALRIGGWRVAVERDSAGVVSGLVVGAGRSSGVRFGRRPSS